MPGMTFGSWRSLLVAALLLVPDTRAAQPFDAAPFGEPLPSDQGPGVIWEDPREIHEVRVRFRPGASPTLRPEQVRIQYWGSWWPERHLPKDREPGGGDIGWLELGNWWKSDWRTADTTVTEEQGTWVFRFRPVNAVEFPKVTDNPAPFRYTLKLRLQADTALPPLEAFEVRTDSIALPGAARVVWAEGGGTPRVEVFNGQLRRIRAGVGHSQGMDLEVVENSDPNTFDRTLVTVRRGRAVFTFKYDDLRDGALYLPEFGAAVLPDGDARDFAAVANEVAARGAKTLRTRVGELPEQTWRSAWDGMPRKTSDIYFPMAFDGGRQRFQLQPDGSVDFRHNDGYLRGLPGRDTPALDREPGPVTLHFDLPSRPTFRTLAEEALPVVTTRWNVAAFEVEQVALVTRLGGTTPGEPAPESDELAVWMARFTVRNAGNERATFRLPWQWKAGERPLDVQLTREGWLRAGEGVRGQCVAAGELLGVTAAGVGPWELAPGESRQCVLKIPYLRLTQPADLAALGALDFDAQRPAVTTWWRERLAGGAALRTPEPMLNEFYRSVAMHLLENCEREPNAARRFARVGSFSYGAYGNESCMMVADLDRRGFHREAQECLDAWLHYQGTVALPGSFASQDGVLYGAAGYEAGGYNQHHGWILWMLAEHYRYTRDRAWLERSAPGIVKGADWILRETARTADRHPLERGLLPAGSLEDIGDWWTWLSTSCYTWRGLDSAAWALEQLRHPDARRLRRGAEAYHETLLRNFRAARDRSPVVRLRDGTAVPKFPSQVHRRGRSFGWICETLEGSLHLLITRALDPNSAEAAWILDDYEDNLYLSNQYGYTLDDFERHWFARGGMSMQACLLLQVEPWLYRDDVKHALRGLFNAQAASYFPDVRMNTEHALPALDTWRGDHFKSSDEANCSGWLRQLFVREDNESTLLLGQAVPRAWLVPGSTCGIERTATWFGPVSLRYTASATAITATLAGPTRNPPRTLRLRFRPPAEHPLTHVTVNGQSWKRFAGEWVELPGDIGPAEVVADWR